MIPRATPIIKAPIPIPAACPADTEFPSVAGEHLASDDEANEVAAISIVGMTEVMKGDIHASYIWR